MISPVLILISAILAAAAVALAYRFARWPAADLAAAAAGTLVAVISWRVLANALLLNEDFMPAISVGDAVVPYRRGPAAGRRCLRRLGTGAPRPPCAGRRPGRIHRQRHHPLTETETAMEPTPPRRIAKTGFITARLLTLLAASVTACSGPAPASSLPLTQLQDITLPGAASRLDYQALDAGAKRLYIAHLGDGTVHVVDLDKGAVAGTVPGTSSVHGVTVAADRHLLLAAVSGTNEVAIIDTNTLMVSARVPAGTTPDGIAYDPVHGKAYVSNEHDHAETVIDLATNKAKAAVEIGGEAGNSVYDPASGTILVNVQDRNELVTIDPATDTVTGRIPVPDCASNHGLYVDGANRLAFIACEGSAKLLVLDLLTRQVTARFDTGEGPDVMTFDQGLQRLYVASESGVVSVFDEQNRALTLKASSKLADNAHSVAVDQATHRVYFPLENIDGHPVLCIMEPKQ